MFYSNFSGSNNFLTFIFEFLLICWNKINLGKMFQDGRTAESRDACTGLSQPTHWYLRDVCQHCRCCSWMTLLKYCKLIQQKCAQNLNCNNNFNLYVTVPLIIPQGPLLSGPTWTAWVKMTPSWWKSSSSNTWTRPPRSPTTFRSLKGLSNDKHGKCGVG
jgi:hypothetical protein